MSPRLWDKYDHPGPKLGRVEGLDSISGRQSPTVVASFRPIVHHTLSTPLHPIEADRRPHDAAGKTLHHRLILRLRPHPVVHRKPRLQSAVLERHGDAIRFYPEMLALAAHHRVEPQAAAVGRGNEMGRVERAISYLRTSFFHGISFTGIDDLNRQAESFCTGVSSARGWPQQRSITVAEALAKGRPFLVELPGDPFPAAQLEEVSVGKTPYVRFDPNRYSVPHFRVRRTLTLEADSRWIRIMGRSEVVAEHRRCWDKHQAVEDPEHLLALKRHKRKARLQRGQEHLLRAVTACETLLVEMGRRQRRLHTAVDRLTILLDEFGADELSAAVDEAVEKGSPHPETVRLVLDRRRQGSRHQPRVPLRLPEDEKVRDIVVTPHHLGDYDPIGDDREPDDD